MNLEDVLGKMQTDRANLHLDGRLICVSAPTITLWHLDTGAGAVHGIGLMTLEDSRDDDRSDPPG